MVFQNNAVPQPRQPLHLPRPHKTVNAHSTVANFQRYHLLPTKKKKKRKSKVVVPANSLSASQPICLHFTAHQRRCTHTCRRLSRKFPFSISSTVKATPASSQAFRQASFTALHFVTQEIPHIHIHTLPLVPLSKGLDISYFCALILLYNCTPMSCMYVPMCACMKLPL